jgi:hypothetical protein
MKFQFMLCLALVFSGGLSLKADDQPYDITEIKAGEIPEGFSGYSIITNQDAKLSPETFAIQTSLGWIPAAEYRRLKLSKGETRISSPLNSKEFSLVSLTDSTKTSYDEMKAQVVVFQDGQPRWQFGFTGFKNFDADWIDEKALKIVSWPGTRVRVTELINVETGKIIYRSVERVYDRQESPSSISHK